MKPFVALALTATMLLAGTLSAQMQTKRLYVKAVDRTGAPVTGLTPDDLVVAEAKKARKITKLAPANDPVRIVMLVDDSKVMGQALPDLKKGLLTFFDAIPAPHEIVLVTVGSTPTVRQEPTTSRETLKAQVPKLSANGPLMMIGAIFSMYDRFLKPEANRYPMFVIVSNDGEDSTRNLDEERFKKIAQELKDADVVVHSVMLSASRGGSGDALQVAQAISKGTSGTFQSISASSELPSALASVAKSILENYQVSASQYVLEYESDTPEPAPIPPIATSREGVTLKMSRDGRMR